ncbi:VanZ family protein [Paenibacillus solani]|uniref:VanZ family protein n=1 Tax=Paenibacillus solani TaxID=1705565 RepID=UPI003D2E82ED
MKSRAAIFALILLIGYSLLLGYWMLWGFGRTTQPDYSYNLVPFITITSYFPIRTMSSWINIVGNIAVFMPFGMLLPIAFRIRYLKSLGFFLAGLCLLEATQLLSRRGSLDVDDIILNSVGFTLGYGLLCFIKKWKSTWTY